MPRSLLHHVFATASVMLVLFASSAHAALASHHATAHAHGHSQRQSPHRRHHARRHRTDGQNASLSTSPLLGDQTVESLADNLPAGQSEAFPFQALTTGITGAAHVYIDSRNGARTLTVGLYSNTNSLPGGLLAVGSLSAPAPGAWNTVTLSSSQLTPGAVYWLAVLGTGGTLRYRDRLHGPCRAVTSAQRNLTALTARWSLGSYYSTCPISAYVTAAAPTLPQGPPEAVEPSGPIEAPSSAPLSTVAPVIGGTPTEGHLLTASAGTWTGAPTSYAYQWQDCDASAGACVNLAGANAPTHQLTAGELGRTIRIAVTAANAGGSTTATSSAVGPVSALAPSAGFTYTPSLPVTGQPLSLDATGSSCPDAPCTYAWSDDGSPTRPMPPLWPLGAGQAASFTFSSAGTKYVRLLLVDASGRTATVEHDIPVQAAVAPPSAPADTIPPTLSGIAKVGNTLTTTTGSWSGSSPITYTYQWQDCNTAGEECTNAPGANKQTYALVEADAGHTVRVIVTAANSAGSASIPSPSTATVSTASVVCSVVVAGGSSGSVVAGAIVGVGDGGTVCLGAGSFPFVSVVGAVHGGFVTVRPVPGAVVSVGGMEVRDSSFLRFEGLRMTGGFNMRDTVGYAGSHDYQFVNNTFEEPLYGIVLYGGAGPIRRVLIEGNYMHRVHLEKPEVGGKCSAGYAQGQDVTIDYAEGVTVTHNTFNEAAWHYIQGGGAGPEGVRVEHNLFEGHVLMACSHLNLWQIWAGGQNDTFNYNIALGEGRGMKNGVSEEAATDGVIFENGAGSLECATKLKNSVIEGNLFVNAADSYELQIYTGEGASIRNNTVIGSQWGTALLTEHCGAGSNYTMTHNINVEDQGTGPDFGFGACTGSCTFDYNISQDSSASRYGATHYQTSWTPTWATTSWNPQTQPTPPTGYYTPTNTTLQAGYAGP
jgi:hypothetical protein